MGQTLSSQGGGEEATVLATQWAERLTPEARRELSKLLNESSTSPPPPSAIPEPSRRELRLVALNQAIPFVGFGFMDNAILIVAGDAIDTSLGVLLGISTMCAAAIGNIVSDVAGILLGTLIEDMSQKLGLPTPNVTAAQRTLRSVRFASQWGCAVGIVVGCLIGMFPLLLIDSNKVQKLKQEARLDSIFSDIVEECQNMMGAEAARIFLVVDTETATLPSPLQTDQEQYLYGKYGGGVKTPSQHETRMTVGKGIISRAVLSGEAINVDDVQSEPDFRRDGAMWDTLDPSHIENMVCVPVFDSQGRVIAVIQVVNKVGEGVAESDRPSTTHKGFTDSDVQVLKVLASHISVSLQSMMYEEDAELTLRDTMKVLKEHGLAGLTDDGGVLGPKPHRRLFPE